MSKKLTRYQLIGTLLLSMLARPIVAEPVAYLLGADELFRIDLGTAAGERVGEIGHPVTAIVGDARGMLFAADSENDRFLRIDRDTGAGTVIGGFGQDLDIVDLTFDDAGRLWAVSCPAPSADCVPHLIELEPDAGTVLAVGPELALDDVAGLASVGGELYVMGRYSALGVVDPVSGAVASVRPNANSCTAIRGASGSSDGTLWAFHFNPCTSGPFESWVLLQSDPQDGSIIGQAGGSHNVSDFPIFGGRSPAIVPARPVTVPSLDVQLPAYADRPMTIDIAYQQEWCFVGAETTVENGRVDILAQEACGCLGSPNPTTFQVEVGPLPIGPYEISLSRQGLGVEGEPCEPVEPVVVAHADVLTETSITQIVPEPPEPTVDDDVSLAVTTGCLIELALERVVDRVVWLRAAMTPGPCLPTPFTESLPLGSLPAGNYTIIVRETEQNGGGFEGLSRFEVRDLGSPTIDLAGRFRVEATWTRPDGSTGVARGRLIPDSDRGAELWFFRPSNPELLVKLLDGCSNNGHRWFFAGGLTNLGVDITVTDRVTGEEVIYRNPLGERFEPIQDTRAFLCE